MTRIDALLVGREPRLMPMDLYRDGEHYVLHLDMPGIDPGSIDLQLDGQVLTIRAERSPRTVEGLEWMVHERPFGTYQRQVRVGPGIELEAIAATLEHGVLTLTMPLAEKAKPRRIEIQVGSGVIEAPTSTQTPALAGTSA